MQLWISGCAWMGMGFVCESVLVYVSVFSEFVMMVIGVVVWCSFDMQWVSMDIGVVGSISVQRQLWVWVRQIVYVFGSARVYNEQDIIIDLPKPTWSHELDRHLPTHSQPLENETNF